MKKVESMAATDLSSGGSNTSSLYDFKSVTIKPATEGSGVDLIWIAGDKDAGKTLLAFLFEGSILCFSYDGKSVAIKEQDFENDERIEIHDIDSRFDKSLENKVKSGAHCTDYIMKVLYTYPEKSVDYVVHDYAELIPKLTEMKGRHIEEVELLTAISKYSEVWKKRHTMMDDLLYRSKKIARKGVIFTGFTYRDNLIVDGAIVKTGMRVPKWFGDVERDIDVAFIIEPEEERIGNFITIKRYVFIHTSKRQKRWVKYGWYDLSDMELAKAFVKGEGVIVDRAPPEPEVISMVVDKIEKKKEKVAPGKTLG